MHFEECFYNDRILARNFSLLQKHNRFILTTGRYSSTMQMFEHIASLR